MNRSRFLFRPQKSTTILDEGIGPKSATRRVGAVSDGAFTAVHVFPGSELDDVLAGCEQLSMEGVVVKRLASLCRPGRRTAEWRKVKCSGWRADHAERRIKK